MIGRIDHVLQKMFRTEKPPLQVRPHVTSSSKCVLTNVSEILPHPRAPSQNFGPIHLLLQQHPN
jgi:hypothetical protein